MRQYIWTSLSLSTREKCWRNSIIIELQSYNVFHPSSHAFWLPEPDFFLEFKVIQWRNTVTLVSCEETILLEAPLMAAPRTQLRAMWEQRVVFDCENLVKSTDIFSLRSLSLLLFISPLVTIFMFQMRIKFLCFAP